MPKRLSRQFIVASWGLAAACNALAMGFGAMPGSVAFGRPLDLVVPLNTAPGEPLEAACLSAEVEIGERRLPAQAVQVVAEPADGQGTSRRLRIQSLQVVDEPIVGISVSAGCRDKLTRQFTVLADPVDRAPPAAMAAERPGSPTNAVPSAHAAREAQEALPAVSAADAPSAQRKPSAAARAPRLANGLAPSSRPPARAVVPAAVRAAANPSTPRLQLDRADKADILPVATVAQAAAPAAASAAAQRTAPIERDVQQLLVAAPTNSASAAQVRARLGAADDQAPWLLMSQALLALLALLGGLAWWLSGRVRASQRERQAGWTTAHAPSTMAPSSVSSSMPSSFDAVGTTARTLPQPPVWATATGSGQQADTRVLPVAQAIAGAHGATPARPAAVEELIDLEQRADFFAVLGQDESAIELLMAHVRGTGGVSPLPYLKLLEIHRRRGDRGAYERTRTRLNYRFNAGAPDWGHEPELGRGLLEYAAATSRLQMAWRAPTHAIAELEALLLPKAGDELFDLPAYRDALMLYAVARDLDKMSDTSAPDVDVLLPLHAMVADGAEGPDEGRPTGPVDLDLDEPSSGRESAFSVPTPITVSLRRAH